MRIRTVSGIVFVIAIVIASSGCISQQKYDDVKAQNRIQQQHITDLESELSACKMSKEQLDKQLERLKSAGATEEGFKSEEIAALEKDIEAKKALIARLQARLLQSGVALPAELSIKLQEFAAGNDLVVFDENTGVLKFKSDLLFKPGSATVEPKAAEAIKTLCGIINSPEASAFDIIVAGHTDNVPIKASKDRHPTNWHLASHRAIGVLEVMLKNGVEPTRLSVRGFGEYRPFVENKTGPQGTPENRRVEIFIVPKGA